MDREYRDKDGRAMTREETQSLPPEELSQRSGIALNIVDDTEKLYEEITLKWSEGTYALAASKRLKDLKRPATKKLYVDFGNFDPKPSFSNESVDRPSFDLDSLSEDALDDLPSSISDWKLDEEDKNQPSGAEEDVADEPGE